MAGPQLAPRSTFDCLWCGRSWTTRSADDLEGWAKLCPDCLGKAGDNAFLRFRLRDALAARAGASHPAIATKPTPAADVDAEMVAYYEARAGEYDDWYLRRGRYARGPIHDARDVFQSLRDANVVDDGGNGRERAQDAFRGNADLERDVAFGIEGFRTRHAARHP